MQNSELQDTSKTSKSAAMNSDSVRLLHEDHLYEITRWDEYTFEVASSKLNGSFGEKASQPTVLDGFIEILNEQVPIQFKIRASDGDSTRFAFFDMSIKTRDLLNGLRARLSTSVKDSLHELSYDDLAKGKQSSGRPSVSSGASQGKEVSPAVGVRRGSLVKKLVAVTVMSGVILGVIGWATYVINSRSTIEIDNGVLVGNYVPVNAPRQSSILQWYVKPGEQVSKGAPIARLSNDIEGNDLQLVEAKLRRAKSEVAAFRAEAEQLRSTMKIAELKLERDLGVAEAEILGAKSSLQAAQAQYDRLEPLAQRGNLPIAEFDEAKALLAIANAELTRQSALKESLKVAVQAAKSNVLVSTHGVSNPMGELSTKIAVGDAVVRELEETQSIIQAQYHPIEVCAPVSGTVYAIYRNEGETVKVADQLMAINVEGDSWAIGTVNVLLSPAIRPGHPVEVEIPSLGITTVGTVAGIGHRSVYGHGGYHAEFRSAPLDVPIRIALDIKNHTVPSGIRLNMAIRVRDDLHQVRKWIQHNIVDYFIPEAAGTNSDVNPSNEMTTEDVVLSNENQSGANDSLNAEIVQSN